MFFHCLFTARKLIVTQNQGLPWTCGHLTLAAELSSTEKNLNVLYFSAWKLTSAKKQQNITKMDTLSCSFHAARELSAQVSGTQPPEFARIFFFLHNPFRSGWQKQYLLGRNLQLSPYIFGDEKKKERNNKILQTHSSAPSSIRFGAKSKESWKPTNIWI